VEVKLGLRRNGEVEVTEGLAPGDVVVTGGQQRVRNGGRVEVINTSGSGV
jgi:membrane fusion protein (multidrug efflux system)